jgi:hypothetical protein
VKIISDFCGRWFSSFAFGGVVAGLLTWVGTRDLENYDYAVFSLDRGTAVEFVRVLGQPVYTLALGLGVRLPLHGNLAASPAAALAPFVALPATYWLLIAFSIGAAVLVMRHALEPVCGRLVSWVAVVPVFWSVPMMSYTIYNDWPETAVTYCAIAVCVFAPHAFLALLNDRSSPAARRLACPSLAATVWAAVALSHPGLSPLLACALGLALLVAGGRSEYPLRTRMKVVGALGATALAAIVVPLADVWREVLVAGDAVTTMTRSSQGATGDLVTGNLFPLGAIGNRLPFTLLALTIVSLAIGVASRHAPLRWLIVASAIASLALGIGATAAPVGESLLAPSNIWQLRDPAAVFGVFSAACAAQTLRRSRVTRSWLGGVLLALLLLGTMQGPVYATHLLVRATRPDMTSEEPPWNRDTRSPGDRVSALGVPAEGAGAGVAFWPGIREEELRGSWRRSTDFADAGYRLVTAYTKQRTMSGLVHPNRMLFNQTTDLPPKLLCDAAVIGFLRLRYLLLPHRGDCDPWTPLPNVPMDHGLDIDVRAAPESDPAVWAVAVTRLSTRMIGEPALSEGSPLLPALVQLPGTSLSIEAGSLLIRLNDVATAPDYVLVFPVAFDPAWHASSGHLQSIGGLLTLTGVSQPAVRVRFRPDGLLWLRAAGTLMAQILALAGCVGLAAVQPALGSVQRTHRD